MTAKVCAGIPGLRGVSVVANYGLINNALLSQGNSLCRLYTVDKKLSSLSRSSVPIRGYAITTSISINKYYGKTTHIGLPSCLNHLHHRFNYEKTLENSSPLKSSARSFHSTPNRGFFGFGLGGPFEVYNSRGSKDPMKMLAPAPVRVFGWVAAAAAVVFFVPVAFIVMATPPILLGIYLVTMRMRRIKNKLYSQRWSNMGSYHLTFEPEDLPGAQLKLSIPEVARKRVFSALELNEHNLAENLGVSSDSIDCLRFTEVQSIQQDFKGSSQGFQEKMEIRSYGLVDINTSQQLATVYLIIHRSLGGFSTGDTGNKSKMRIEVVTSGYNGKTFVLDEPQYGGDDDVVIDVKPSRKARNASSQGGSS